MKYFILFAITLTLCACSNHDSSGHIYSIGSNSIGKHAFTIHNNDDNVVLGINDSIVYMQLSKEMLNRTNSSLASDSNNNGDWAVKFSNFVKSHVKDLVNSRLEYRISDINSVSYKDNGLIFDYRHKHFLSFERVIDQGNPALKSFSKKNAEAFIAHFNAIKDRQK